MNLVHSTPMSLENRRRAVYTALIEHLDGDDLWEALVLWEDVHAGSAAFSTQKFLSDILTTPALRAQRVRILQSLVRTQSLPAASLLPDPREQLLAYRLRQGKVVSTAANSRDTTVAACAGLIARVLAGLDGNNRLRMRLWILDNIERTRLPATVRHAVRQWLSDQGRLTLMAAEPEHLRLLVNLAYIGLCEFIGPVAADAALNRAVQQLGQEEPHLADPCRALL